MRIQNTGIDFQRSGQAGAVQGTESEKRKPSAAQPVAPVQRNDKIQISDAGRALAAQQAEGASASRSDLSAERVGEIRNRIMQGAYNSLEVVEEVARRMLERGDI